jgi:hypothetical protein
MSVLLKGRAAVLTVLADLAPDDVEGIMIDVGRLYGLSVRRLSTDSARTRLDRDRDRKRTERGHTKDEARTDDGQNQDKPGRGAIAPLNLSLSESDRDLTSPKPLKSESARARGTRISHNWTPSPDCIGWCREQGADWVKIGASFRDYWCAVAGSRGVKLDWDATFRNWVRRELGNGSAPVLSEAQALRERSELAKARERDQERLKRQQEAVRPPPEVLAMANGIGLGGKT